MAQRVLTGLVGIPVLVGAVWVGFPWLTILVAIVAVLSLWEFYRISPGVSLTVLFPLGAIWTILFLVSGQLTESWYDYAPHALLGAGVLCALPWLIVNRRKGGAIATWSYTVCGPVYVGFLLAHGLMLRGLELDTDGDFGRDWLIFALLVTFATDTGAYFAGRSVGKHLMTPSISPHKTWEGAIGGFASAVGVAFALAALLELSVPIWQGALIGLAIGTVAQAGDLAESQLKRATGVKDTGKILPGHGGVLDRIDSIVFTFPVVYYLVALALKPST